MQIGGGGAGDLEIVLTSVKKPGHTAVYPKL